MSILNSVCNKPRPLFRSGIFAEQGQGTKRHFLDSLFFHLYKVQGKLFLFLIFSLQFSVFSVYPVESIEVYLQLQTHGQRVNLGIANFLVEKTEEEQIARDIRKVVLEDLLFTHFFNLLEEENLTLDYKKWGNIGAQALVVGEVGIKKESLILKGKLIDLETEEEIFVKIYESRRENWREIAHRFSDDIVFRFTGEKGIAQSKIVFVNDATGNKEVYLVDYDGENLEKLTEEKSLVLLPRWDSRGKNIVYTSYRNGNPDLYWLDLGRQRKEGSKRYSEPLLQYQGLNLAGSFSSDGKYLALTLTKDGNPEIYILDLEKRNLRRLTYSKSVDIAPRFAPNGKEIVFISDRQGNPQVYIVDIEGLNLRRITEDGYYDSPFWSPRGDLLAYVRRENENFQIYILNLKDKKEMQLTFFGSNENPTFSPDGRWVAFVSNRNGKYELYRMRIDGSNQQKLVDLPGEFRTPVWSP